MKDPMGDTWELEELLAVFDVEPLGSDRFCAAAGPERLRSADATRAMIDGSQILGQAVVAASRAESGRFVKSAHMIFARAASAAAPIELLVERIHSGRSFSSLSIRALQGERLCASGLLLLDDHAPNTLHHSASAPRVCRPEEAAPFELPVRGRELRVVSGADYAQPDAVGPPSLDVWVRYERAPKDLAIRQALLAHLCGPFSIGVAMRPHPGYGETQAHRAMSTGVLSLTVHFHEPCTLEGWLLYGHESVHAGRGLCDGVGRIFADGERLVASFAQEGMLRPLRSGQISGMRAAEVL